jgi:dihydrofolate reductase
MRRLSVFNSVSVDGYVRSVEGDLSWAHGGQEDPEFQRFVAGNASGEGTLLFGRTTYEMMVAFWPTPAAAKQLPEVAAGMNRAPKVVFSRTLTSSPWQNTTVEKDLVGAVKRLKGEGEGGLTILGSGSIVAQLAKAGLVDEFQVLVVPVVLGAGETMFHGLARTQRLKTTDTRTFGNGFVYTVYEPAS